MPGPQTEPCNKYKPYRISYTQFYPKKLDSQNRHVCPFNAPSVTAENNFDSSFKSKAVNRGDKRTRRVRDRDFVKFERSRRYRDRYRCQEKKSPRGRARDLVFRDPPRRERDLDRCLRFATPPILP